MVSLKNNAATFSLGMAMVSRPITFPNGRLKDASEPYSSNSFFGASAGTPWQRRQDSSIRMALNFAK